MSEGEGTIVKLVALDIPDDPGELGRWMDQRLVGADFAAFVAELNAVHPVENSPGRSLPEVLGDRQADILAGGLSGLPSATLSELLRQPGLLVALQEFVLAHGGPYWQQLLSEQTQVSILEQRGRQRLSVFFPDPTTTRGPSAQGRSKWYRRPWVVALATAAAVLVAVSPFLRLPDLGGQGRSSVGWGWEKLDAREEQGSSAAYLEQLAAAAGEWFQQPQDTPAGLSRRLGEFRAGCSTLIFAEHRPLSPEDRRWLLRNCRRWAARLDELRAALENGKEVAAVRTEADDAVRQMMAALRSRADSTRQPG
jgi:hypothetical protein